MTKRPPEQGQGRRQENGSGKARPRRATKSDRQLLVSLVLISTVASAALVLWSVFRSEVTQRVDSEDLPPDVQDPARVAESFVNLWSTFRYDEALAITSGETRRRVELALEKERELSPAEQKVAEDFRRNVEGLHIRLNVTEVTDEETDRKILRGTAVASAEASTLRRHQTFVMVREGGEWKVAEWDPGESEPMDQEGIAEPGLQLLEVPDGGPHRGSER